MPLVDAGASILVPALILMAAAIAVTAFRADAALSRSDGEKLFWTTFTGLLTTLLVLVWAVAGSPGSGPWMGLAAAAGAAGAAWRVHRRHRRRGEARRREDRAQRIAAIERRHDAVLRSWSAYELDGWKALEKPGLTDAARGETRILMRAMKSAAAHRPLEGRSAFLEGDQIRNYAAAVTGLEKAWESAEASAGGRAGGVTEGG